MTRALDGNGHIVDVKDVVSGKACNCTCIGCQGAVWAMKGPIKAHYFAHEPNSIEQNSCTWKPETEIHILGKVRTSIPRTKNENFSHLISMGYH
ncbi:hypothetical protein KAM336_42090 [Aeromonas caviae]|nr:hypothetical protein KAM336_42090 [Aeromonas caviae]